MLRTFVQKSLGLSVDSRPFRKSRLRPRMDLSTAVQFVWATNLWFENQFFFFYTQFQYFLCAPSHSLGRRVGFFSPKPIEKIIICQVFSSLSFYFLQMESEKKKQKLESKSDQATMSAPKTIPGESMMRMKGMKRLLRSCWRRKLQRRQE